SCWQARHVAAEAILVWLAMRCQKRRAVALEAARTKIRLRVLRERVRIVARAAPEFISAAPRTLTQRELLRLADDRQSARVLRVSRRLINVNRKHVFEILTRVKVGHLFAGIRNGHLAAQVALLANAVASARREFCRIDNRSWHRAAEVLRRWPVTSLTGDRFRCKRGVAVRV